MMMKLQATPVTIPAEATSALTDWPELRRERRVIVVVDVVESVRLMQADEAGTIDRWRRFVHEVRTEVLPANGGRMVKSLGDGMLLEFQESAAAMQATHEIQRRINAHNAGMLSTHALLLRCGVHVADVVEDADDVYGAGVNLTARIAALAQPGSSVVSDALRDDLVDGLDGRIKDLGPCYFKHIAKPVHCFEVQQSSLPVSAAPTKGPRLLPVVVVLPMGIKSDTEDGARLSAVMADRLVIGMAKGRNWRVVSRLSVLALDRSGISVSEAAQLTDADYVLSCSGVREGPKLILRASLTDATRSVEIWSQDFVCRLSDLLADDADCFAEICNSVSVAVLQRELASVSGLGLRSLPGHSLLLGAMQRMHRLSVVERGAARDALGCLVDRHPRSSDVHAWKAKWHFLRIAQIDGEGTEIEARKAREHLDRALDLDPDLGLALSLKSHLLVFVDRDLDAAHNALKHAVAQDGSEPLGWLFLSHTHAMRGEGSAALAAVRNADQLSPLDPFRYFVEMMSASAYLADGQYAAAVQCASRSVELNAIHLPGLLMLIIAQQLAGYDADARSSALRYLAMRPEASAARYLSNHPVADSEFARRSYEALRAAGIPH
jgi:adenylate cyclase